MTPTQKTPAAKRGGKRLTPAVLMVAIAALHEGLSSDEAGTRAGITGRALRKRLVAVGLRERELQPPVPRAEPPPLDLGERHRRLSALARERQWERERERLPTRRAYSRQASERRRDLHVLLTVAAWEAVHEEAQRRRCSLSSLVADVLHEAGIIPEA